ncbi:hypothetical protein LCGC14_1939330, partial [marine sediment metagenome]
RDFFGQPTDTVGPLGVVSLTAQLVEDLFVPIGPGNLREAVRQGIPGLADVVPEGDSGRLGIAGSLVRSFGPGVRAEVNRALRNRKMMEFTDGAVDWDHAEPWQQRALLETDPDLQAELDLRREAAAERGSEAAEQTIIGDERRDELAAAQLNDDRLLQSGGINNRAWRLNNGERRQELRIRLDEIYGPGTLEDPQTPRDHYVNTIREHTDASDQVNWDAVDAWRATLSDEDNAYIDRNTGFPTSPMDELMRGYRREVVEFGYWDVRDESFKYIKGLVPALESFEDIESYMVDVRRRIMDVTEGRLARAELATLEDLAINAVVLKFADPADQTTELLEFIGEDTSDLRADLLDANPRLAALLVTLGYRDFGNFNADLREAMRLDLDAMNSEITGVDVADEQASPLSESKRIDPQTEQMAAAFAGGDSYGQIAIQFEQPSAEAVKKRLKRFAGGSPVELLRT